MSANTESGYRFATKTRKRSRRNSDFRDSALEWVSYWRANLHRFVKDYFQLDLKPFQEVVLYQFSQNDTNIMVASRGIGKSFITAVYACAIAILYPNSNIVIVCAVKDQAKGLVSKKIEGELFELCPAIKAEVREIKTESEAKTVIFKNGSKITATNASENRRGFRATLLIFDEAVQIEKNTIESVCLPFLNAMRVRGYTRNPKYANYIEMENQAVFLTSAWYKSNFFYSDYYVKRIKDMIKGGSSFVVNFSVKTPLRAGLITEKRVESMKQDLDPMKYEMEMSSCFFGESANSFFKADEISRCRTLERCFYPPTDWENRLIGLKSKEEHEKDMALKYPKEPNEIRILSADIALMGGDKNDNSVYTLFRVRKDDAPKYEDLDYQADGLYHKEITYMEAHNGVAADKQALIIKRLFYDYKCNVAVLDTQGVGMAVFGELKKETIDLDRKIVYPPWGAYNESKEEIPPGTDIGGVQMVLYSMKADAKTNHQVALGLKGDIMGKKIKLLRQENEAREILEKTQNFSELPGEEQAKLIAPFLQTTSLFAELISLEYSLHEKSNQIQVKEQSGGRKDRYSSVGYGNYVANLMIKELSSRRKVNVLPFYFN